MHGVASSSLRDEPKQEEPDGINSLPLEEFFTRATVESAGFSPGVLTRFLNSMKGRDGEPAINTVDDLLALSETQFKGHYGIGKKAFTYVQLTLTEHGLTLGSPARA